MRTVGIIILVSICSAAVLPGQNRRLIGTLKEDLRVQQDKYYQAKVREQRLMEMRIRHDMGLPVRAGRYLEMTEEEVVLMRYADKSTLTQAEEETRQLARQLATLQDRFEGATGALPTQAAGPIELPITATVTMPPMKTLVDRQVTVTQPEEIPAAPAGETQVLSLRSGFDETSGEVYLLKGSPDAANIGRVLLLYGVALLDQSKILDTEGSVEEAGKYRTRAQEELNRAKKALDPLIWREDKGKLSRKYRKDAALPDMFMLAQCEEKLGNYGQAEELYLQIQGLDRSLNDVGNSSVGEWGNAADVANRVMKFMLEHGQWEPVPSIDSLKWQNK